MQICRLGIAEPTKPSQVYVLFLKLIRVWLIHGIVIRISPGVRTQYWYRKASLPVGRILRYLTLNVIRQGSYAES